MIVSSTEVQNNFGKYLVLAAREEVIITRNGREIAKLTSIGAPVSGGGKVPDLAAEKAEAYGCFGGRKASYEEFLDLTRDTEDRYEYIDGEIYLLASPKTAHQIALTELFVAFYHWFQGKNCTPLVAPYDITLRRTPGDINVVQPDIMVLCDLEEKLDENDYYQGVPSLTVEILSECTRRKDLIKKLDLYMSCEVKEYWIVNPINKEVTIYYFTDKDIRCSKTYRKAEYAQSCLFEGLSVELTRIFRSVQS